MPQFKVEIYREVITHDLYTTEIEADNFEDAQTKADELSVEMNSDCPDGIVDGGHLDIKSWQARVFNNALEDVQG